MSNVWTPVVFTYADYLHEAATLLEDIDFGFASINDWNKSHWEYSGKLGKGRAKVIRKKAGVSATAALNNIFDKPTEWSFDCSQFCQVVNFYAEMQVQNAKSPGSFDNSIKLHGDRLEIRPFRGAYFTMLNHYYRRESQSEWLKYRIGPNSYIETNIRAWDLVRYAPLGSRINFSVGAGGAFNFENVIKVNMNPLQFGAQVAQQQKVYRHDELLVWLAEMKTMRQITGTDSEKLRKAAKVVWIKEVSIFKSLNLPKAIQLSNVA